MTEQSLAQPTYYEKYLALGEKGKDFNSFLGLFEMFNRVEWEEFLLDLLEGKKSYPDRMIKYQKEFSPLDHYSGILSNLSIVVKKDMEKAMLNIALPRLQNRTEDAEKILLRQLELSKLMTRGLPMFIIIDHLLAEEEKNHLLKYRAAMTLAFYEEEGVERFWQIDAKKMLETQPVLAIPRFLALKRKNRLEALKSLVYAKQEDAKNISPVEWNFHFAKIIRALNEEQYTRYRFKDIYQQLHNDNKEMARIFDISLTALRGEEFSQLRDFLNSKSFLEEVQEDINPLPEYISTIIELQGGKKISAEQTDGFSKPSKESLEKTPLDNLTHPPVHSASANRLSKGFR